MSKKTFTPPKKAKKFWNKHVKRGAVVTGVKTKLAGGSWKEAAGAGWNKLTGKTAELQTGLNDAGADPQLKVDDFYGPKTAAAVKNYNRQSAAGMQNYQNEDAMQPEEEE